MKDSSIRMRIMEAIEGEPLTARDISKVVGTSEREVLEHLEHVRRSVGRNSFVIVPPECKRCGFVFTKRERLKTPGRCPLCRSEVISEARYGIKSR